MVGFPKTEKTYCERGGLQFGGWTFIEVERDYWQRALVKTRSVQTLVCLKEAWVKRESTSDSGGPGPAAVACTG